MVQLTRNFSSETPLHGDVLEAINATFEGGWADPKKISQASSRAAALKSAALEELAAQLSISASAIEPIGEPALVHQLAIEGYLREGGLLVTSNLDLGKVRAVAHGYQGPQAFLQSAENGTLKITPDFFSHRNLDGRGGVLCLQERNGEIGVTQDVAALANEVPETVRIVLDCTRSIPGPLHRQISAATYEATSWQGPSGIGFLIVGNAEKFRYPLPHLALIRAPGSFSLPLLVGSIVALNLYKTEEHLISQLRRLAIARLSAIPGVRVLGDNVESSARYLSLIVDPAIVDRAIGEEITIEMNKRNISIDTGSACSPDYLAPSHVIKSLGFNSEGHLRITLNTSHTSEDVELLADALGQVLARKF